MYTLQIQGQNFSFPNLKTLLAKATPVRSGDQMAGIAATSLTEMVAAQTILADLPLKTFLTEFVIPPEEDEVTRLILQQHDAEKFRSIAHLTVGGLRDFLLSYECDTATLTDLQYALTPEMVAAVTKIMRNQDLVAVASKCRVVTKFRNTIGLEGRFSTRLQPNDPCDDLAGITSGLLDGLSYGCGDAVLGINPASDDLQKISNLLCWLDALRQKLNIPTQTCVLTHVSNSIMLAKQGVPVDLFFQSIGGTEAVNKSFGIDLALLREAHELGLSLKRGTVGNNCMYFETGQGSALSAGAHHGVDQQTIEARSYAVAREFSPLLVNTVVGFIGPEYLLDGKQITRAALEDHFCGKLLGLPMGCDVCYTNHSFADQNDMDNLLSLLAQAGCNFVMAVPGADDVMLNYQSTSYQDANYIRQVLRKRPGPEFEAWLERKRITSANQLLPQDNKDAYTEILEVAKTYNRLSYPDSKQSPLEDISVEQLCFNRTFDFLSYSNARIGLGHTGGHTKSRDWLHFQAGFAQAKDAVGSQFTVSVIDAISDKLQLDHIHVNSLANEMQQFLLRPDLGRLLSFDSQLLLAEYTKLHPESLKRDVLIVISGGLSPIAIERQIPSFLPLFVNQVREQNWSIAPVMIIPRGRVALGDQLNAYFHAKMVVMLIGERPGLSSHDSMGIYFTLNAEPGCTDEKRNCISNIHQHGLSAQEATRKLIYMLGKAFKVNYTGVNLKDDIGMKQNSGSLSKTQGTLFNRPVTTVAPAGYLLPVGTTPVGSI